jgi:molybdate transport system ATP-binding protein
LFTIHDSLLFEMLQAKIKKRLGRDTDEFFLDVEFEVRKGVTILFGASGSGKSTTLRAIAGIIHPDEGQIKVDEQIFFDSQKRINLPIRKRGVGYVFQNLALFPHLSVRANVEFGMKNLPPREKQQLAAEIMSALKIEHTANRKPREVSGGEAQRVALARALLSSPKVLLLDEPLSAIDEATKSGIIDDLKLINRDLQLPILYVTHSRDEALTLGERVIVYERGRVVACGEPLEVFRSPLRKGVARLTGVENIFTGSVVAKNEAGGTMTVEVKDQSGVCRIDVPFGNETIGKPVTIAVPANDILLATQAIHSVSARNILRGQIFTIEGKSNRTEVRVKSGVLWSVSVTRQAVKELQLRASQEVWLAIKTHSCYLLDD